MAVYGIDFYGLSLYGAPAVVQYSVDPFTASSTDYNAVTLTWSYPNGTWTGFRLIRNWSGYPIHETDGQILLDITTSPNVYIDSQIQAGRFLYYAIFLNTASGWTRVGITSCLVVNNYDSLDWIWNRLPNYYKYSASNLTNLTGSPENAQLKQWMSIFAWGADNMRTLYGTLLGLNDPSTISHANLSLLAQELGIVTGTAIEGARLRQFVAGAAQLYREKGEVVGTSGWIRALTGWDLDIEIGRNLLLNDDVSAFWHPQFPSWDPALNYATGEQVRYNRNWYQAKSGGAYGPSQAPSGSTTNNTWWTWLNDWQSQFSANPATGGMYTWEVYGVTTAIPTANLLLSVGQTNPLDPTRTDANSLVLKNGGTTQDVIARSVSRLTGQSTMDYMQPILDGIPVPYAYVPWQPTTEYKPNQVVVYGGRAFQALRASKGMVPPVSPYNVPTTEWACVGQDGRVQLLLSGYAHASWTNVGTTQLAVYPRVEWYDQNGVLISTVEARTSGNLAYDSFNPGNGSTITSHTPDMGSYTWTTPVGAWTIDGYLGGNARPTTATRSIALINGDANCQLSVTLSQLGPGTLSPYLLFRYSATNSYFRAGVTTLDKFNAGVKTTLATWTAINPGDRLTVVLNGSSIIVKVNGTQVGTATDSFNSTATQHGLLVE